MRSSSGRPRWRRARPHTIRLVSRSEAADLARALDRLDGGRGHWARCRLRHGSIRGHLVVELPADLEVDGLAMVLVGLEDLSPQPIVAVVGFDHHWLVIEARGGADPVSRAVTDIDHVLMASSLPPGAGTMPLRELDAPGTIVAPLVGVRRQRPAPQVRERGDGPRR